MTKAERLQVKTDFVKYFNAGYPLINKDAIKNIDELKVEGTIIDLFDEKKRFLAKGYYGKQNKGRGWVLTRNPNEVIDQTFFENKLKLALDNRKSLFDDPETTAFRVFNGEGDGIGGLTIDYYDGYFVMSWYKGNGDGTTLIYYDSHPI